MLNPGWVVVRIRRVSAQRYRLLVRQPSRRGRYAMYFVNWTVRKWSIAKIVVIKGATAAMEYENAVEETA